MSGQIRCSDEFRIDAVAQITERGYSVKELARVTEERDILRKVTVYFARDAK